jgi:hypothetical protein
MSSASARSTLDNSSGASDSSAVIELERIAKQYRES